MCFTHFLDSFRDPLHFFGFSSQTRHPFVRLVVLFGDQIYNLPLRDDSGRWLQSRVPVSDSQSYYCSHRTIVQLLKPLRLNLKVSPSSTRGGSTVRSSAQSNLHGSPSQSQFSAPGHAIPPGISFLSLCLYIEFCHAP